MAARLKGLIHRLVFENLKHRPLRTLLSLVLIGAQVTMILALVGVSRGVLGNMQRRAKGTGADIIIRPPDSSVLSFSSNMSEKIVEVVRGMEHVKLATGALVHPISNLDSITGIHLDEFNELSGGLVILKGKGFEKPDDLLVDRVFAQRKKLEPGSKLDFGHLWNIVGVVEEGKLSATFADIAALQDIFGETGKISYVYVKLDDPKNTDAMKATLQQKFDTYKIYSMEEFTALFTTNAVPLVETFIQVVVGIGAFVGFLVVFLSMYMAVLERTREIGILKAMGASPGYIVGILLRETVLLALAGTALGIAMAYGTRALLAAVAPNMPQVIVPDWYLNVAIIALGGSLAGAVYPGLKAAKQDAIEALAYD
ncbi:MAG: FtsX-like permease family protein [Acidobacteriota bacterium]